MSLCTRYILRYFGLIRKMSMHANSLIKIYLLYNILHVVQIDTEIDVYGRNDINIVVCACH